MVAKKERKQIPCFLQGRARGTSVEFEEGLGRGQSEKKPVLYHSHRERKPPVSATMKGKKAGKNPAQKPQLAEIHRG